MEPMIQSRDDWDDLIRRSPLIGRHVSQSVLDKHNGQNRMFSYQSVNCFNETSAERSHFTRRCYSRQEVTTWSGARRWLVADVWWTTWVKEPINSCKFWARWHHHVVLFSLAHKTWKGLKFKVHLFVFFYLQSKCSHSSHFFRAAVLHCGYCSQSPG